MPARTGSALLDSALWTSEFLQGFHEGRQGLFGVLFLLVRALVGFLDFRKRSQRILQWFRGVVQVFVKFYHGI